MKLRNLNAEMLNEKGEPYTDRVTVRKILIDAAGATVQAGYPGINEKPGDKYTLGLLAVKLFRAKATVQIESGEVTLLKARIAALCSPLVVARMFTLLEEKQSLEDLADKDIDVPDKKPPELAEVAK